MLYLLLSIFFFIDSIFIVYVPTTLFWTIIIWLNVVHFSWIFVLKYGLFRFNIHISISFVLCSAWVNFRSSNTCDDVIRLFYPTVSIHEFLRNFGFTAWYNTDPCDDYTMYRKLWYLNLLIVIPIELPFGGTSISMHSIFFLAMAFFDNWLKQSPLDCFHF